MKKTTFYCPPSSPVQLQTAIIIVQSSSECHASRRRKPQPMRHAHRLPRAVCQRANMAIRCNHWHQSDDVPDWWWWFATLEPSMTRCIVRLRYSIVIQIKLLFDDEMNIKKRDRVFTSKHLIPIFLLPVQTHTQYHWIGPETNQQWHRGVEWCETTRIYSLCHRFVVLLVCLSL